MPIPQSEQSKTNQELHRKWRDSRADWDEEARKDLDFFLGNHFTADESSDLSSRNQAERKHETD